MEQGKLTDSNSGISACPGPGVEGDFQWSHRKTLGDRDVLYFSWDDDYVSVLVCQNPSNRIFKISALHFLYYHTSNDLV